VLEKVIAETDRGLYCSQGDFYIDPWKPVNRAVITHAHSDHARWGCRSYVAAKAGEPILRMRLGNQSDYQFLEYGQSITVNGVRLSLHPAGHMTGSAQVRLEYAGQVVVISGDYKRQADPTCASFEPIRCHTFVTESTFGLPIYRWHDPQVVFNEINQWWQENQQHGRASVLFGYTVGKAQRLLAGVDRSIGPIFGHGAILRACDAYRACCVDLPEVGNVMQMAKDYDWSKTLIVAPPSARGGTWLRRFGDVSMAMASGWMRIRGVRRRRVVDRGFVMSDHVDWLGLLQTIKETDAASIWVTHGYTRQVVEYLRRHGWEAKEVQTRFQGELENDESLVEDREPADASLDSNMLGAIAADLPSIAEEEQ
jgi:putative mRNA 3-end processing factor